MLSGKLMFLVAERKAGRCSGVFRMEGAEDLGAVPFINTFLR